MKHYRVELHEAKMPSGYTTATIRSCMCCGVIISGMGGGGDFLCHDCVDKMCKGEMAEALYLLSQHQLVLSKTDMELLSVLELSEKAIQAAYNQADAEWRKHNSVEAKCDKIITDFRKKRDAAIKKVRTKSEG